MPVTYLLLGGNIGDTLKIFADAEMLIGKKAGQLDGASSVYRTQAWGETNQQDFLNKVIKVRTELDAAALLSCLLQIENDLGRVREKKWAARLIDLDILFYDEQVIHTEQLHVPHPYLAQRRFTLVPLNEIAPNFIHPELNLTVSQLLANCHDISSVVRVT